MMTVIDTSILVDLLSGEPEATEILRRARRQGPLRSSEVTRLEILSGMPPGKEWPTRGLLNIFSWHPVDEKVAEIAGELGRQWLAGHPDLDSADLAIAATALALDARLLTRNVTRYPMFSGLAAPY